MVISMLQLLFMVSLVLGQSGNWTQTSAPSGSWHSMASDNTGQYLAAVQSGNGYIYTSSSGGSIWTQTTAPTGMWLQISSDSTGQYLVATQGIGLSGQAGYIYTSSSAGSIWTQTSAPASNWFWVDSTGQYLAAVQFTGYIYTSSTWGSSWSLTSAPYTSYWQSIASDSTGQYLAAAQGYPGYIWTSSSGGRTWNQTSAISYWQAIASDSTGTYLAAAADNPGYIYTSSTGGTSWSQTTAPSGSWIMITSDSSGTVLVAGQINAPIYISTTRGSTWSQTYAAQNVWWNAMVSGPLLLAAGSSNQYSGGGYIYIFQQPTPTHSPTHSPTYSPTPTHSPTHLPTPSPTHSPTFSPTHSPTGHLLADPLTAAAWTQASVSMRVEYYIFTYAIYFIAVFLILLGFDKINLLKKTSNILHKSAFDAQVVDKFYSREPPGNSNMVIRAAFQNYFQSSSETDDDGNVDMRINVGDIWSNAKKQNVIGFHDYLIMQHTYLGSRRHYDFKLIEEGLVEDLLIYLFNNQSYFRCFCSLNCPPLTRQSQRFLFLSNQSVLFFLYVVINDLLVFRYKFQSVNVYIVFVCISNLLAMVANYLSLTLPLKALVVINKRYVYDDGRDTFRTVVVYLLLFFVIFSASMTLLILICIMTTPNENVNVTRFGVLDTFIWQVQISHFVLDLVRRVTIPKIINILTIGQRYVEQLWCQKKQQGADYFYKKIQCCCIYIELACDIEYTKWTNPSDTWYDIYPRNSNPRDSNPCTTNPIEMRVYDSNVSTIDFFTLRSTIDDSKSDPNPNPNKITFDFFKRRISRDPGQRIIGSSLRKTLTITEPQTPVAT